MTYSTTPPLAILMLTYALTACGGTTASGGQGGTGGGHSVSSSANQSSSSSGSGGSTSSTSSTSGSSSSSGGGPSLVGTVLAASWAGMPGYYVAEATFEACTRVDVPPCYMLTCPVVAGNHPNAGTITITGGAVSPITMVPMADGTYPLPKAKVPLWSGGESILFSAPGSPGGVGAFQGTLQPLPPVTGPMLNGAPWPPTPQPLPLSKNAPFTVGWGSPAPATVYLGFEASDAAASHSGYCAFPGAPGSGAFPPDLLKQLPSVKAFFNLLTRASSDVMAGSVPVTLILETWVTRSDGGLADATVLLQ